MIKISRTVWCCALTFGLAMTSLEAEPPVRSYIANGLDWTGADANGAYVWGMNLNPINNVGEVDVDNNGTKDFHESQATAVDPSDGLASNNDGLLFRWDYGNSPSRAAGLENGDNSYTIELALDIKSTGAEGVRGVFGLALEFTESVNQGRIQMEIARNGLSFYGGTAASNVFSDVALSQSNIGMHTWRIAYDATTTSFWFYRDGKLLNRDGLAVPGATGLGNPAATFIGDYTADLAGDWELDYIALDAGGAYAAPPLQVNNWAGAADITTTSATLRGELDWTNASPTTVKVFWGTSNGGAVMSAWGHTNTIAGATVGAPLQVGVTLVPGNTYYYRYYAENALSQAWAPAVSSFSSAGVTIEATDPDASEVGPDTGEFTVSRGTVTEGDLTVGLHLSAESTATDGQDFHALTNAVTIPDGASNTTFQVAPVPDSFVLEGAETVVVAVSPGDYAIGSLSEATVTIAPAPDTIGWPFDLTRLEGLALWLDASDVDGDGEPDRTFGGTAVSQWTDKSGRGNHAVQAAADRQPTVHAAALNDLPTLAFDGSDHFAAGAAGAFDFLHDGSGGSVFVVYRKTSNEQLDFLLDTGANTGGNSGFSFAPRDDGGYEDQFYFAIAHGGGGAPDGFVLGGNYNGFLQNAWTLVASSYKDRPSGDDVYLWRDGAEVLSEPGGAPDTTGNASRLLGIGAYATGDFSLNGDIAEVILFDRAHGSNVLNAVGSYLEAKYALDTGYDYGFLAIDNNAGATDLTTTSATLNGRLTSSDGLPNTVRVFWGETDGGTDAGAWANTNNLGNRALGSIAQSVTLQPNRQYYYRYFVSTVSNETWAPVSATLLTGPVTLAATDDQADEVGRETGTFTLSRPSGATSAALSVAVRHEPASTATEGADYVALPALNFTLQPGQVSTNITITPIDDWILNEGTETVTLSLLPGPFVMGTPSTSTVQIACRAMRPHLGSSRFDYRYDFNGAHPQNQDLDNDTSADWGWWNTPVNRPDPWPGAPSGSVSITNDLTYESGAGGIWRTADFSGDYSVEVAVRVNSQSGSEPRAGAMTLWTAVNGAGDDTGLLYVGTDSLYWGSNFPVALDTTRDNTGRFHNYRIVRRIPAGTATVQFWVWRDDRLLNPGGLPLGSGIADANSRLLLGDTSALQSGTWDLDHIRLHHGAFEPTQKATMLIVR